MRTTSIWAGATLTTIALLASAFAAPASAAGGYNAKPPTTYRGRCELTAPAIPSRKVGDRCIAVARVTPPRS